MLSDRYLSYDAISTNPCPERLKRTVFDTLSSFASKVSCMVAAIVWLGFGAGMIPLVLQTKFLPEKEHNLLIGIVLIMFFFISCVSNANINSWI